MLWQRICCAYISVCTGVPVDELFFGSRGQRRHGLPPALLLLHLLQQLLSQHQMLLITTATSVTHTLDEGLSVVLHRIEGVHTDIRSMRRRPLHIAQMHDTGLPQERRMVEATVVQRVEDSVRGGVGAGGAQAHTRGLASLARSASRQQPRTLGQAAALSMCATAVDMPSQSDRQSIRHGGDMYAS